MWSTFVHTATFYWERPCKQAVDISIVIHVWRIFCRKSITALLLDCEQALYFFRLRGVHARAIVKRRRREKRGQDLSRLAPSSRAWSFACRACLARLTKKKRDFTWSTLRQNTFVKLKSLFLQNFPVVQKVNNAIFIQWIMQLVSQLLIHWIVIYAFQSLNNRGQVNTVSHFC